MSAMPQPSELVEVEDLDQFAKMITVWHAGKVKVLEHFLQMPEGNEMQVGDEEPIKLEGDVLKGMKAGVQLALMEFGFLPFVTNLEAEPAAANDASATPA